MKLIKSVSRWSSIVRSLRFLFKVLIMNSSRFVPVESVYVSKLESRESAGDVPLSDTVDPWEPLWPNLRCRSSRFAYTVESCAVRWHNIAKSAHTHVNSFSKISCKNFQYATYIELNNASVNPSLTLYSNTGSFQHKMNIIIWTTYEWQHT